MELYEDPIVCDRCNGTGKSATMDWTLREEIPIRCPACQGSGLDDEYDCSTCQRSFSIIHRPPYKSGTSWCCFACAVVEEIDAVVAEVGRNQPLLAKRLSELADDLHKEAVG